MKDWTKIPYLRLYLRTSSRFKRLPFLVRGVASELLRHADPEGHVIEGDRLTPELVDDLCFMVASWPKETAMIRKAIYMLLTDDGTDSDPETGEPKSYLVFRDGFLTIRNFAVAQAGATIDKPLMKTRDNFGASFTTGAPDTVYPTDAQCEIAKRAGVDIVREWESCRDWNRGKGNVSADWDATFSAWLRRQEKWSQKSRRNEVGSVYSQVDTAPEKIEVAPLDKYLPPPDAVPMPEDIRKQLEDFFGEGSKHE